MIDLLSIKLLILSGLWSQSWIVILISFWGAQGRAWLELHIWLMYWLITSHTPNVALVPPTVFKKIFKKAWSANANTLRIYIFKIYMQTYLIASLQFLDAYCFFSFLLTYIWIFGGFWLLIVHHIYSWQSFYIIGLSLI